MAGLERKITKKALWHGASALFIFMVFLCCVTGCQTTKVEKWKPVRSQHKNQVHTVKWTTETLPAIAKWYTGTEENWKKIANANPNILPGKLNQGDRIFIPSTLLKTRAEMTNIFLEEWLKTDGQKELVPRATKQESPAPLLVPKLHKLKDDDTDSVDVEGPPDLKEPDDDGDDLELFGPK